MSTFYHRTANIPRHLTAKTAKVVFHQALKQAINRLKVLLIFTLLGDIFILSCVNEKKYTHTFEGTVIDSTTNNPVVNAKLILHENHMDIPTLLDPFVDSFAEDKIFDPIYTNNSGYFHFQFEADELYHYSVGIFGPDSITYQGNKYAKYQGIGYPVPFVPEESFQFTITPHGLLLVELDASQPFTEGDSVRLTVPINYGVDTTVIYTDNAKSSLFLVKGNELIILKYSLKRVRSEWLKHIDSVYCKAFQVTYDTLEY